MYYSALYNSHFFLCFTLQSAVVFSPQTHLFVIALSKTSWSGKRQCSNQGTLFYKVFAPPQKIYVADRLMVCHQRKPIAVSEGFIMSYCPD